MLGTGGHGTGAGMTTYLLGHDERELVRLEHQARVLAPATRAILGLARVTRGMRVLDLGTGAGDVAFEVAELVGPGGSVVGVDRSAQALRYATARAGRRGLTNVSFVHGDLGTVAVDGMFDAVVGRLVLLYVPDPADVVRRFAARVRPGGVFVSMEYEMTAAGTLPPTELSARTVGWITDAFERARLDVSLGARLGSILRAAGLHEPTVLGVQSYHEPGDPEGPRLAAETVRTLLPVIEKTGVATRAEIDIDTLADRLALDGAEHGTTFKPPVLAGAWAAC